jgi:triosephosphate isomerase
MRKKVIAGNWKMNCTVSETEALISELLAKVVPEDNRTVVVCPPFTALHCASKLLKESAIRLGSQDMSAHESGAYTSEVSAQMLLTLNVTYTILGHSERRQYHAETNALVNAKARAALANGLTPIMCVGETLDHRQIDLTEQVIGEQIEGVLSEFTADMIGKSVIAYEPVWAIGTGKTATPEMAQAVHRYIREKVALVDSGAAENLPILYGGSVKPGNAEELLSQADIDGALVGGAALKAEDFVAIINAV